MSAHPSLCVYPAPSKTPWGFVPSEEGIKASEGEKQELEKAETRGAPLEGQHSSLWP